MYTICGMLVVGGGGGVVGELVGLSFEITG